MAGQEARVVALLSIAYSRAVAPSVLGNIKRAAKAWNEGDDCLAYIHLAHTRLGEGLHYSWNRDEALLHFNYDAGNGEQRTFAAYVDGDTFRDEQGRVIGRVLPDGGILIESAVASPELVKDDEPRLCPIPGPDKPKMPEN